jgi:hypothetical protein
MTRGPIERGCSQYLLEMGFSTILYVFYGFLAQILWILAFFGGSRAFFEARSWEEVGRRTQTQYMYNSKVFFMVWEVHISTMMMIF